jgi:HEAT repeat protein
MKLNALHICVLAILSLAALSGDISAQTSAAPAQERSPECGSRVPELDLTKADIPSNLPGELKEDLGRTFDPDPKVRAKFTKAIGKRGEAAAVAVPFLIRLMNDDVEVGVIEEVFPRATVRNVAVLALTAIGGPAVEPCIAALRRSSAKPRLALIHALGWIRDPRAIEPLALLLTDLDPRVRMAAVMALSECNDPRVVPHLLLAMKDRDEEVQNSAILCLGFHRDPRAVDAMLEYLKGRADRSRVTAVEALGRQADRRAVPALLKILRDAKEDEWMRFYTARSLGQIGDRDGNAALLAVLNDRSLSEVARRGAACGLGATADKSFAERLTVVATDAREASAVRAQSADAIAVLQGQKAIPLLRKLAGRETTDDDLRCCAAMSLVRLTGGAIEDVDVDAVSALPGRYMIEEAFKRLFEPREAQREALKSVVKHGKTKRVRAAAKAMLKKHWYADEDKAE